MVSDVVVADKAMVDPTERSMPPVMMTSVMPSVAMAMNEKLRTMFEMLPGDRKLPEARLIAKTSTMSARST